MIPVLIVSVVFFISILVYVLILSRRLNEDVDDR